MRRVALWAGVAVAIFASAVALALFLLRGRGVEGSGDEGRSRADSHAQPPDALELCRVLAAPREYEGRILRVRATYFSSVHGPRLYDKDCVDKEISVSAVVTADASNEIAQDMREVYGQSDAPAPLELIAVGRFDDNHPTHAGRTVADNAPYKFELMRVEQASRAR